IAMAAIFNLTGALLGGAVASTIGKGLVDTNVLTMATVLCALIAAFAWNITTWWVGFPSSPSHALISCLCGAALASACCNLSDFFANAGLRRNSRVGNDTLCHYHGGGHSRRWLANHPHART